MGWVATRVVETGCVKGCWPFHRDRAVSWVWFRLGVVLTRVGAYRCVDAFSLLRLARLVDQIDRLLEQGASHAASVTSLKGYI